MNWFKRPSLLGGVLLLLAALLGMEAWLWTRGRQTARRALAALEEKKQERDWLARQSPALSEANEQAIARDLAAMQQQLEALRSALHGKGALLAGPPPAKAVDLFFDLAGFVEKTRTLAARAQVMLQPDERFGFATHANEGPEPDLVPAVWRQRIVGQYLVETLVESRPRALLRVQRERPLTAVQRAARNQPLPASANPVPGDAPAAGTGGQPADFFEFDPQLSVRVPGEIESDAFRLEFTGQTAALRAFLNNLATFKLPLVVRSVDVQPLAAEATTPDVPSVAAGAPVPLVSQSLSKFAVVVEFVVRVSDPEKPTS
ncbi:MAG: hypothetical protein JWQ62_1334 [Lacunisphaera sp.]|nr:hypothetical protein [Lacunisphaera sp.]